jgi:hypothetical protein
MVDEVWLIWLCGLVHLLRSVLVVLAGVEAWVVRIVSSLARCLTRVVLRFMPAFASVMHMCCFVGLFLSCEVLLKRIKISAIFRLMAAHSMHFTL